MAIEGGVNWRAYPIGAESWAGEIVGPSLAVPGWWNIRRIGAHRGRGHVFAVPDGEIGPRKC